MRNFIALVQRRTSAGKDRHKTLCLETVRGCRANLMTTGSVNDKRTSGHPFTSQSAGKVERVLEMFMRSLHTSTHQAARESRLTKHNLGVVLGVKLLSLESPLRSGAL